MKTGEWVTATFAHHLATALNMIGLSKETKFITKNTRPLFCKYKIFTKKIFLLTIFFSFTRSRDDFNNKSVFNMFFEDSVCIKYRTESLMTWESLIGM